MKTFFSSGWRRVTAAAGVLAVAVAVAAIVHARLSAIAPAGDEGVEAAIAPAIPTVAVVRAVRRTLERTIALNSELIPYDDVKLYAKESGYLRSIDVDYGSRVSAGETLATLELPEQAADLSKSDAAYNLAQADYERVASVDRAEPGLIAQADVDKARADYLMAQDQRERASVVEGYGVITAPFDGVVVKRFVDPGALIEQGTTGSNVMPIVEVADVYRLRLVVETPESLVPLVHVGMPVTVTVTATGEKIVDRVARFSYDVHEDTRTMHTEIDVDNPDLHLKPGMYATANILLASAPDAVAVPTQAVSTDGTPNVWVVGDDGVLRRRNVGLGLQTPEYDQVTHGIVPGDRIFLGDRTAYSLGERVAPKILSSARA